MMRILRNFVDVKLGLVANWWHCLPRCPMKLRVRSFTPFWLGKPLRLWSIWAHLHSRKKVATRSFEDLLSRRFPEKDASDEMWENLTDIFNLRANEGESLKAWISRACEAFDKLQRTTNVSFTEEARGWVILHRSGLTSEQQAAVLARSLWSDEARGDW